MTGPSTYAAATSSIMEVTVLEGGADIAIAFLHPGNGPTNVVIRVSSAVDLASKIMRADADAARERVLRADLGEVGIEPQ